MLNMMLFPAFVAVEDCGVSGLRVTSLYHLVTDLHPLEARSQAQTDQDTPECHCLKHQTISQLKRRKGRSLKIVIYKEYFFLERKAVVCLKVAECVKFVGIILVMR